MSEGDSTVDIESIEFRDGKIYAVDGNKDIESLRFIKGKLCPVNVDTDVNDMRKAFVGQILRKDGHEIAKITTVYVSETGSIELIAEIIKE